MSSIERDHSALAESRASVASAIRIHLERRLIIRAPDRLQLQIAYSSDPADEVHRFAIRSDALLQRGYVSRTSELYASTGDVVGP